MHSKKVLIKKVDLNAWFDSSTSLKDFPFLFFQTIQNMHKRAYHKIVKKKKGFLAFFFFSLLSIYAN